MAIIDREGRVFGKINLIDFLALTFSVLLVIFAAKGVFIILNPPVTPEILEDVARDDELYNGDFIFVLFDILPEDLPKLSVGARVLDRRGRQIAEIKKIYRTDYSKKIYYSAAGKEITMLNPKRRQLVVKMTLWGMLKHSNFIYERKVVKPFKVITFPFPGYSAQGYMADYETEGQTAMIEREEQKVKETRTSRDKSPALFFLKVKFDDLSYELSQLIEEGDRCYDKSDPSVVAEISGVISCQVHKRRIDKEANFFKLTPSRTFDLTVTVRLTAKEDKGNLYFMGRPVEVGGDLIFSTDSYETVGTIVGVSRLK